MPASDLSVLVTLPARLLNIAVRCGLDREAVLATARVDPAVFTDRDNRLPVESAARLWQVVMRELPDRVLALELMADFVPGDIGVLGYVLHQTETLEGALEAVVRYMRLANQGATPHVERSPTTTRVRFSLHPSLLATQQLPEATVALLIGFIRRAVDLEFAPSAIHLPHPRTERSDALEQIFRVKIDHGQPGVGIEFPSALLSRPVVGADPNLAAYLRRQADLMLSRIDDAKGVSHETARRLAERLGLGEPSQALIAKQLGLSERTLQRRLQEEGTTFNRLLESTRKDVALGYLANPKLAAYEVSFLVGYTEPATFFRAFKRWTGKTPQQYRASAS